MCIRDRPHIEGQGEVIIITIDVMTGDVERVIVRSMVVEQLVTGVIKRGVANAILLGLTKIANHREEGAATEEHREVVELQAEAVVGILQAVQPLQRKTSKDSG